MARIVFIGDDFTGASDTLATLAERGLKTRLFLDAPKVGETEGLDAVGIATDLRARPPQEISERLHALAPAVTALDPRFVHYKVCSTFDSAPHVGSIGAAVDALEKELSPTRTIVLGGQPSLGRYCIFGTLFARAPDGETYRIDRHPIMSRHPVTPMDEADLRAHLSKQGLDDVALVDQFQLRSRGPAAARLARGAGRSLVDATEQSDVECLGEVLHRAEQTAPVLIVGASSVAEALSLQERAGDPAPDGTAWKTGALLALAGSRSSATAAQVDAAVSYERVPVEPADLLDEAQFVTRCVRRLDAGNRVLVHLRPELSYGQSPAALSEFLARLAHSILDRCRVAAVAVAGGDTSSAVVRRLGFRSLSFVERMGAGVAVCRGHAVEHSVDGTVLLLKGGQVGDVDLFECFAIRAGRSPA